MGSHQRCIAVLASLASSAAAEPAAEMALSSCVGGSPPLRVPASAECAALEAGDGRRLHAAARYPLYERRAIEPSQVLLLRRRGQWL